MIDWLDSEIDLLHEDRQVFPLWKAAAKFKVHELKGRGYLVLNMDDDLWLKFAVLRFASSSDEEKSLMLDLIFHGEGPSGSLRECRHTYWGEDGYIFYPPGPIIADAFRVLSEFYDDLTAQTGEGSLK